MAKSEIRTWVRDITFNKGKLLRDVLSRVFKSFSLLRHRLSINVYHTSRKAPLMFTDYYVWYPTCQDLFSMFKNDIVHRRAIKFVKKPANIFLNQNIPHRLIWYALKLKISATFNLGGGGGGPTKIAIRHTYVVQTYTDQIPADYCKYMTQSYTCANWLYRSLSI